MCRPRSQSQPGAISPACCVWLRGVCGGGRGRTCVCTQLCVWSTRFLITRLTLEPCSQVPAWVSLESVTPHTSFAPALLWAWSCGRLLSHVQQPGMEGPWGPTCEPRLTCLQQGVLHGRPHACPELGAAGPRGPGQPSPPTTTCVTSEFPGGARRAGLGTPREAGHALCCPTRNSASGREVLSACLLHSGRSWWVGLPSTAEPSLQHGGPRVARGVWPTWPWGLGVWCCCPPGGALSAHRGCLGRVQRAAPHHPPS